VRLTSGPVIAPDTTAAILRYVDFADPHSKAQCQQVLSGSKGDSAMRFLLTTNGGGTPPDEAMFAEMGKLVEELARAGVLLATGGLDQGAHIKSAGGKVTITDGPFTRPKR
jgi:hypothetical protein